MVSSRFISWLTFSPFFSLLQASDGVRIVPNILYCVDCKYFSGNETYKKFSAERLRFGHCSHPDARDPLFKFDRLISPSVAIVTSPMASTIRGTQCGEVGKFWEPRSWRERRAAIKDGWKPKE